MFIKSTPQELRAEGFSSREHALESSETIIILHSENHQMIVSFQSVSEVARFLSYRKA